jgi:hypothetical protein
VPILLDNAIDALGESGKITLRTRRDGECIVAEVADTGPGIPPQAARAFEPSFTTKDVGRGTGLGLGTARRMVEERHGGSLALDSGEHPRAFHAWVPMDVPMTLPVSDAAETMNIVVADAPEREQYEVRVDGELADRGGSPPIRPARAPNVPPRSRSRGLRLAEVDPSRSTAIGGLAPSQALRLVLHGFAPIWSEPVLALYRSSYAVCPRDCRRIQLLL